METKKRLLLKELSETVYISADKLANKFQISRKTIQKYFREMDAELAFFDGSIESKRGKGYRLIIGNRRKYHQVIAGQGEFPRTLADSEDRMTYILNRFLQEDYVKLDDLAEHLYSSKQTISRDIQKIKSMCQPYQLQIISRPHYGLYLKGSESNIRNLMLHLDGIELEVIDYLDQVSIRRYLLSLAPITAFDSDMIMRFIQIAMTRCKKLSSLPDENRVYLLDSSIKLPKEEIDAIKSYIQSIVNRSKVLIVDVKDYGILIEKAARLIEETFGVNLFDDAVFKEKLVSHLFSLKERLQNHIMIKNPLLEDIKSNLHSEFLMAMLFANLLKQEWSVQITDDEVGFLTLIFATCATRTKILRKRMLVVCSMGQSSLDFLQTMYQSLFDHYVREIEICEQQELKNKELADFDVIISTVPLDSSIEERLNVYYVPYFLKSRDTEYIIQHLKFEHLETAEQLFEKLSFFNLKDSLSKEEVVITICEKLNHQLNISITDEVLQRLDLGVTQLTNQIALLHPCGKNNQYFMSLTVLDEPLFWETSEVRLIFLVSLPTMDNQTKELYQVLSSFMMNESYIADLLKNPTAEHARQLFSKIISKEVYNEC